MTSDITPITAASKGGTTARPRSRSPLRDHDHARGEVVYRRPGRVHR